MVERTERTLYVLATPIGNLGDLSARARATLADCAQIAAEDTRVARKLLTAAGITGRKIVSVREHNERSAAEKLATRGGGDICYICDAGTPAVSDPGALLVAVLRAQGFAVVPVPGPCAAAAALSAAGLAGGGFVFLGFLPRSRKSAAARLGAAAALGEPLVLYESPRRAAATMSLAAERLGAGTPACLCRELTKIHEQIVADEIGNLCAMLASGEIPARGEFVAVLKPGISVPMETGALRTAQLLSTELPIARAAKLAAKICGANARDLYRFLAGTNE